MESDKIKEVYFLKINDFVNKNQAFGIKLTIIR